MDQLTQSLLSFAENSFPVCVSVYLLLRIEKRLDQLTSAVRELIAILAKCVVMKDAL
jgi:hypothetical protein